MNTNSETSLEIQEAFKLTKLHFLTKQNAAFISSLLHNFKIEYNSNIQSIEHNLNEQTIIINPDWFISQEPELRASALAEQIYHCAFLHQWRMGKRDPELYQKACDEVVRLLLSKSGFELPFFKNANNKFLNRSVEYVYTEMEKEYNNSNNKNNKDNSNNPYGNDVIVNAKDNSQPSSQAIKQMQQNVTNASLAEEMSSGKTFSDFGSELQETFKKLNEGKLQWNVILQNFLNEITQSELSYEKFDRRLIPMDLYLPSKNSKEAINKVAIAFDVSGSVSKEQIEGFIKEMKSIKSQLNPKTMDVVTFNHSIVDIFTFEQNDTLEEVTMNIGGGTSLHPVFDYYLEPKNKPEFLIVFSDLECNPIADKTPFHTIWICIDNPTATVNFGKLIHINTEDLTNV